MYRRSLSSRWTFVNRFVLPVLMVLATDALAVLMYVDGVWPSAQVSLHSHFPNRWFQIGFWLIWIAAVAGVAWTAWHARRVETDGDSLFISDYRQEVQLPVAAVIDVRQNILFGAGLVWLKLEAETPAEQLPWGQWVAFFPTARLTFGWEKYRPHPIVAELQELARQARRLRGEARIREMASGLGRRGGFGYTRRS